MERNVIVGNSSVLKKSALFRWPSRSALPVSMLSITTSTVAVELDGSVPSRRSVPVKSWKLPLTLVTMACRATKPIVVCAGSIVYSPVRAARSGLTAAAVAVAVWSFLRLKTPMVFLLRTGRSR
ncbi:hypothetical protein SGRIM128S_07407 [Streptomyces griseomycini]